MEKTIIKVKPQGYCGGVLKAISIAKQTRQQYPTQKITILGNLVHNTFVKQALQLLDIQTIENSQKTRLELLEDVDSDIVIFTAHGVSEEVKRRAEQKGLIGIDASCPFVLQTQKVVKEKLEDGYEIFYIGKNRHPEAEAIYSTSIHIHLIEKTDQIPRDIEGPIFVTNQTTMSILDIQTIFDAIRTMYPNALFHDEICNATRVRQQAILDLRGQNMDCLVVVGDPTSNNSRKLAQIGQLANIPFVKSVESIEDINIEEYENFQNIAVTSGASTPTYLTDQIIAYLKNPSIKEKIRIEDVL